MPYFFFKLLFYRAMDICKLMTSQGLQLAITYASRIKRLQLASRISGRGHDLTTLNLKHKELVRKILI